MSKGIYRDIQILILSGYINVITPCLDFSKTFAGLSETIQSCCCRTVPNSRNLHEVHKIPPHDFGSWNDFCTCYATSGYEETAEGLNFDLLIDVISITQCYSLRDFWLIIFFFSEKSQKRKISVWIVFCILVR